MIAPEAWEGRKPRSIAGGKRGKHSISWKLKNKKSTRAGQAPLSMLFLFCFFFIHLWDKGDDDDDEHDGGRRQSVESVSSRVKPADIAW